MTKETAGRAWSLWRRLAAEFVVIVVGVLVALGVDAAWGARQDRVRGATYLRQLQADLSTRADALAEAISVDQRARDGADRALAALNASPLPPADSLATWITAATNSSAAFYPTMGTVTVLVDSGELRLIRDEDVRRKVLQYHSGVASTLRIVDAVDPHMWRTLGRIGGMLSWPALLQPDEASRFTIDWSSLASDPAFHGALFDLRLAAGNRLFALTSLRESLGSLLVELDPSSGRP